MNDLLIYFIERDSNKVPIAIDENPDFQSFFNEEFFKKIRSDYKYDGTIYGLYQGVEFNLTYNL